MAFDDHCEHPAEYVLIENGEYKFTEQKYERIFGAIHDYDGLIMGLRYGQMVEFHTFFNAFLELEDIPNYDDYTGIASELVETFKEYLDKFEGKYHPDIPLELVEKAKMIISSFDVSGSSVKAALPRK
jgi:hypothetical protein